MSCRKASDRRRARTEVRGRRPELAPAFARASALILALAFALALALALIPAGVLAQSDDTIAVPRALGRPTGYVTDEAGVLERDERERIAAYLGHVERSLDVQFAVVIVPTVAPRTLEEYAVELYEQWGIGGARLDEGLLLLVALRERKVRFEVGYGLEGALPDGRVGGIIRAQIRPRFQGGDYAGGILAGLVEAARYVAEDKGRPAPVPEGVAHVGERPTRADSIVPLVVLFALVIFALVMGASRRGSRGRRRGNGGPWGDGGPWFGGSPRPWLGGWRGGGFGGLGGGGFGGGFGGGGSGGGFGGFGGGASGGGGATGGW